MIAEEIKQHAQTNPTHLGKHIIAEFFEADF